MRELPLPTLPLSDLRGDTAPRRSLHCRSASIAVAGNGPAGLEVVWARHDEDVREAQRLRHLVFVEEMGARLSVPHGSPAGHDIDVFDPYCEHLLVRAVMDDGGSGPVIGTYRVLTPAAAERVGGLYSETEFDLTRLRPLRSKMVELGRSCVHPEWRSGGAILALWAALAEFMTRNDLDTMVGCASISMRDGGHAAASLWEQLRRTHLASLEWQVRPRTVTLKARFALIAPMRERPFSSVFPIISSTAIARPSKPWTVLSPAISDATLSSRDGLSWRPATRNWTDDRTRSESGT